LKVLTVLDQPALPVDLNARLELAAAFEGASIAPATQAGHAGASLGIVVQTPQRRSTSRWAINAAVQFGAEQGSEVLEQACRARRFVANHGTH
jgi:hypothetical protein